MRNKFNQTENKFIKNYLFDIIKKEAREEKQLKANQANIHDKLTASDIK